MYYPLQCARASDQPSAPVAYPGKTNVDKRFPAIKTYSEMEAQLHAVLISTVGGGFRLRHRRTVRAMNCGLIPCRGKTLLLL